jgi:hypothetical protein
MEYERTTLNREHETPDQNGERLQSKYEQTAVNRENEGPEQQQQRQTKDRASKRASSKIKKKRERRRAPVKPKAEEHIDPNEVPDISQFVETTESLKCAFEHLMKTRVKEDEHIHASPGINFPLQGLCHQANVCVCCDRFITGTGEVRWISKRNLLVNKERLVDEELPEGLRDWIKSISNNYRHYDYYGKQTYQEYLEHLKNVSVYATTVDLYMLSNFLEVGIVLYSSSYQRIVEGETRFVPNMQFASAFETRINLFYDPIIEHYEPIRCQTCKHG